MPPLPPSWDAFHPLVVHFPIALLLVAPLFVLIAGATGKRSFMVSALLLLILGVAGAFVATNTGEAAFQVYEQDEYAELIDPDGDYYAVMDEHKEGTEFARNVFTVAAVLYAIIVALAFVRASTRELKPRLLTHLVILAILGWGNMLLANAAHLGGELVHRYGVRAAVSSETSAEEETTEEAAEEESDETPADEEASTEEAEPAE